MGRPLKGTLRQLPSGSFEASLPIAPGEKRRSWATFADGDTAEAWLAAGKGALAAGRPLPEPARFKRTVATKPATQGAPSSFAWICWDWHRQYYDYQRKAGPERAQEVAGYITNHLLPYFGARRQLLAELDDPVAGPALVTAFVRHLAAQLDEAEPTDRADSAVGAAGAEAPLMDAAQAAAHCGCSRATIDRRRREGRLEVAEVATSGQRLYSAAALREAGLLDAPAGPAGLARDYAGDILWTLKQIVHHAVVRGWLHRDATDGISAVTPDPAHARRPPAQERPQRVTLTQTRAVAGHLSVIHQLVLYLLRVLGLRIGEAFGVRVGSVLELDGGTGLLVVDHQGGRSFLVRDDHGKVVRRSRKERLKTDTSYRAIAVPPALMALIRYVIAAYHTDPTTGEVDLEARLIPGIQKANAGGQAAFRSALKAALLAEGLGEQDLGYVTGPHHLRKSLITDLAWTPQLDGLVRRQFVGHARGVDVHDRHYVLDPGLVPILSVADALSEQISAEVGDLLVPTTRRPQWGCDHPLLPRLNYVDLVLAEAGWQIEVDVNDPEDPWCDTPRVARELGIAKTTARRRMAAGAIPTTVFTGRHGRGQRYARLSDLDRLREERRHDPRASLPDFAEELGLSYHQAYRLVREVCDEVHQDPATGVYLLDEPTQQAIRDEQQRVEALHRRAMKAPEAAKRLGCAESTIYLHLREGKLPLDSETDGSRAKFIPRAAVEELLHQQQATETAASVIALQALAQLSGLSRPRLLDLAKAGHLEIAPDGRNLDVTLASVARWATGYRPDLLPALPDPSAATRHPNP